MAEEIVRDGSLGWRGWLVLIIGLTVAFGTPIGLVVIGQIRDHSKPRAKPTVSPLSNEGYAYWYRWDVGNPHPHHLGVMVQGDHLCSEAELRQAAPSR